MKATFQYTMLLLLLLQLLSCTQAAFVLQKAAFQCRIRTTTTTQQQRMMLLPMDHVAEIVTSSAALIAASSSNIWIATIDSDIANIPQNEFASVFTGGLVVMSGGLLSALIVGFILESRNLYASVVVDSYIDSDSLEDEEFWKSLSDEEKKKTKQVLDKIKQQKQQGAGAGVVEPVSVVVDTPPTKIITSTTNEETTKPATAAANKEGNTKDNKKIDMFSDYGD